MKTILPYVSEKDNRTLGLSVMLLQIEVTDIHDIISDLLCGERGVYQIAEHHLIFPDETGVDIKMIIIGDELAQVLPQELIRIGLLPIRHL